MSRLLVPMLIYVPNRASCPPGTGFSRGFRSIICTSSSSVIALPLVVTLAGADAAPLVANSGDSTLLLGKGDDSG